MDDGKTRWKRRARGGSLLIGGSLAAFLMMANDEQLPRGPLWGLLAMLVATVGLLDLLGILLPGGERLSAAVPLARTAWGPRDGEPRWLSPMFTAPVAVLLFVLSCALLGWQGVPWAVLVALAPLVPAALRRPALLVFVLVTALLLPFLGVYGLWDPWETHYGEVAREILSRDDWISLWWAQENWFWSKPILIFWAEALSMGIFGTPFRPDANPPYPEWPIRLPIFLMALVAVMLAHAAIRRVFGTRAGVLAALVLATSPHFFFLSHQAITDMPFVANMTAAVSLLVLALRESPDTRARDFRLGPVVLGAQHALVGGAFLLAAPQALYLASRNVTWLDAGFAWHRDRFLYGSAGNNGIPGNARLEDVGPYLDGLFAQPMAQGLLWATGLFVVLWVSRAERGVQRLLMGGFYVFAALSFMGKGIPGFALPGAVALLYLIASGRWSVLLEGRLRIGFGALLVAVVGLPWYVAMYIRHGPGFTDRLLVHDHINRLAAGVHGDTGSAEYFLEQLGVATFPWVGLVPAAATLFLWHAPSATRWLGLREPPAEPDRAESWHRTQTLLLLGLWLVTAFVLFSAMITKFHHYIFPAVPPAALLVGVLLDRFAPAEPEQTTARTRIASTLLAALAPLPLVLGIAGWRGDVRGVIPEGVRDRSDWVLDHPWNPVVAGSLVVLGVLLLSAAWWVRRSSRNAASQPAAHHAGEGLRLGLGIVAVSATVLVAFVGRDLSWVTDGRPHGYERLIHLFVYNYQRPWPEQFDYRPILTGFALVAGFLTAMLAWWRLRTVAVPALVGLALSFAAWSLDVYLVDLSPHWGQKELVARYYAERRGPEEPLVAWQMNWKGENFYTGNRVSVFVDLDNTKLREWMRERRGQRVFFLLEHGRLGGLRGLLGGRPVRELTTMRDCNKFILVETTL
ncbi:MAG: glycosyltransferase family 39 protein [Myxococcota bacterium]|nr:glycosyltransferase family 39 protein [Myxococcota bacterium]MDW8361731.1 glycosyltransferase family 39 protein [Myxococcales bacterium]